MTERSEKMKATAKEMVDELQQARDEVRLQLHLAGMEAKDQYGKLEPKLLRFEAKAHEIGDDAAHELEEGFHHLREAFRSLKEKVAAATKG